MEQSFDKMMNGYQQEMWKHSKEYTDGGIYTSFKLLLRITVTWNKGSGSRFWIFNQGNQ